LLNDIAFSKGEEPLIAPALWRCLSDAEKREIGLSLRHPNFRADLTAPRIIKLEPRDFVSEVTPDLAARLPAGLADRLRGAD
jgi:hypothetical protein